jgi:hypothetical protein
MLQRIHEKLGTAGFIISIVALVAALGGGAYAASGGLTKKQKKEVETISKKFAGAPGSPGAPGAKGDTGAAGGNGTNGSNGTNGAPGTSVTNTPLAKGNVNCPEGGAEFKVGSGAATRACNGTTGFTSTLPPEKTETGTWSVTIPPTKEFFEFVSEISFPIPLPEAGKAVYFNAEQVLNEEFSEGCSWKLEEANAVPKSTKPGTLCVFAQEEEMAKTTGPQLKAPGENISPGKYGPAGSAMFFTKETNTVASKAVAYGTWAVTAPKGP